MGRARLIEETLASFGAPGIVVDTSIGPTVTMFGVEPRFVESRGGQMRVRVGKIAAGR
jgi:S-DNA-T family DNA segregation ATPase FtsK/SpoIIIE